MALKKYEKNDLALAVSSGPAQGKKVPKKVLDEDKYGQDLQKIIVRDFFPDLPVLQAQEEYITALQQNDMQKLRELSVKFGPKIKRASSLMANYNSPATFETPSEEPVEGTPSNMAPKPPETATEDKETTGKDKDDTDLHLDQYLAKNTSEDNQSFEEILDKYDQKQKEKYAWLYEAEQDLKKSKEGMLGLPGIEKQADAQSTQSLQSWEYRAKNAVMYVPEGVGSTLDRSKGNRQINYKNTRFTVKPFSAMQSKQSIAETATEKAKSLQGKIGLDGKEILPQQSPSIQGFGFVATPSPAPGVNESPMMTWGEIEGTPFRLDGSNTPLNVTPGPAFKIPNVPKRDRLALELAEKASKSHRAKKEEALQQVNRLKTPSPMFGSASKTDRLGMMSPAAQRLASAKLGIRTGSDKALRASYTPSPRRTPSDKLPTPSRTPGSTRKKHLATPKQDIEPVSLTDNLLNLPKPAKRPKSQDFF